MHSFFNLQSIKAYNEGGQDELDFFLDNEELVNSYLEEGKKFYIVSKDHNFVKLLFEHKGHLIAMRDFSAGKHAGRNHWLGGERRILMCAGDMVDTILDLIDNAVDEDMQVQEFDA
jgi:hypothetical protein